MKLMKKMKIKKNMNENDIFLWFVYNLIIIHN